jgi:uncharacterized membrane protein YhiD involved in acid resistance
MDILQQLQEKYIEDFTNNVPFDEFIINILITAMLAIALRWYYIRFGTSISNRTKFANVFLPLALGTVLIIMVVKSSIALSLGLVGALSIVRFRAAIKEPEELTYLFIVIGIGLAGGANQPVLAIIAFIFIVALLFLHGKLSGNSEYKKEDNLFLNIHTDLKDLEVITNKVLEVFPNIDLKRLDSLDDGMDLTFICKAESIQQINEAQKKLSGLSPATRISIIEQPEW